MMKKTFIFQHTTYRWSTVNILDQNLSYIKTARKSSEYIKNIYHMNSFNNIAGKLYHRFYLRKVFLAMRNGGLHYTSLLIFLKFRNFKLIYPMVFNTLRKLI